jgi:hypothetical protein
MRSNASFLAAVFTVAFGFASACRGDNVAIPDKFKGIILYAPGIGMCVNSGTQGVYRLKINEKNGTVDEVGVLRRAGPGGDGPAVKAFLQWKFQPGKIKQIEIPVAFERDATVLLKHAAAK